MSSLSNSLLTTRPRENAGSETDSRYNYQKDLALYMLIDLHQASGDYVMLFDYHDDIALLDQETAPQYIDFYQIKTKGAGHWLMSDLTLSDGKKLSILGKLYQNKLSFDAHTRSLNFVTNAGLKLTLQTGKDTAGSSEIRAADLKDTVIKEVNEKLQLEHGLDKAPAFETLTAFKVSPLSLKDSARHCSGALNTLFEKLNPNYSGNTNLAYKKIFNEIKIRTDRTIDAHGMAGLEELVAQKGISKREFGEILRIAGLYRNADQIWSDIHTALTSAGAGVAEISQYKRQWRDVYVRTLNQPSNIPLVKTVEYINGVVADSLEDPAHAQLDLRHLLAATEARCTAVPYGIFDTKFIRGAILNAIYND